MVAVEWEGEDANDDTPDGWGKPSMSMKELYASGDGEVNVADAEDDPPRLVLVLAVGVVGERCCCWPR